MASNGIRAKVLLGDFLDVAPESAGPVSRDFRVWASVLLANRQPLAFSRPTGRESGDASGFEQPASVVQSAGDVAALAASGSPGDLDPGFGAGGIVRTDFDGHHEDVAHAVVLQPDGRIVVAGSGTGANHNQDFALARYLPDGTLDASFAGDGTVLTDSGHVADVAYAVALQADGHIVAAGSTPVGTTGARIAVLRYASDGRPDAGFDGDGVAWTSFGGQAFAVAVQPDDRILVAGYATPGQTSTDFALLRYGTDGRLDSSFDGDGAAYTDFGASDDVAFCMLRQPDGRIVVAGRGGVGDDFAVARYLADGRLDTTFGAQGKVLTSFGNYVDEARGIALQPDGRIVVAGTSQTTTAAASKLFALVRYDGDGTLDTSFGDGGIVLTDVGTGMDSARGVVVQPDGGIVVVGTAAATGLDAVLVRYDSLGRLDAGFGDAGRRLVDIGGFDNEAHAVALQSDGAIVAAGKGRVASATNDFVVIRLFGGSGPLPELSVRDAGSGEGGSPTVSVTLSAPSTAAVTVDYETLDGSAVAGNDYVATSGTLTFLPGQTTLGVVVPVLDDSRHEAAETFRLRLSNPAFATIADELGVVTILDDDPLAVPVITRIADDTGASDSDGITRDATQTLTITADPGVAVRVFDGATDLGAAIPTASESVYRFGTAALADGVHLFTARASDGALQSAPSTIRTVDVDTLPPAVVHFSPSDGEIGVDVAADIVVVFGESVERGAGAIVLRNAAGTAIETYDVAANQANLSVSDAVVVVDPTADLEYGTEYRLEFAPGSLRDVAGNDCAGTTGPGFRTDDYASDAASGGRVENGGTAGGQVETARDVDWFAVSLVAGTRYQFRLAGSSVGGEPLGDPFLTLNTAAGTELAFDDDSGGGLDSLIDYVAESSGTFYLGARHYAGGTGRYTVSASAVTTDDYAGDASTVGRAAVGGVSFGSVDWPDDGDWFALDLEAGRSYQFRLSTRGLADPYLTLHSPAGIPLLGDDDGGGGTNALLNFTAPASGRYFLAAADAGSGTGAYTLSALRVATDDYAGDASTTGRLAVDGVVAGRIETPRDVDWFAMEVSAGMRYQFRLVGDGSNDPWLDLYGPDGVLRAADDDSGGGRCSLIDFVAVADGTIYLAARDYSTRTGGYALSAVAAVADDYARDASTTGRVSVGGATSGRIEAGGDHDWFAVSLVAGQRYRFDAIGDGLDDPVLALHSDPSLIVGWNDDRSPGELDATIVFAARTSGLHYLDVSAAGDGLGSYTVTATPVAPPDDYAGGPSTTGRLAVGIAGSGQVETTGDVDWFAVVLTAHVPYQFRASANGIVDPYLQVFGPDGATVLAADDDGGGANDALVRFTPSVSGTYYVAASDAAHGTGGYVVGAEFVPPPTDTEFSIDLRFELPADRPQYASYLPYFAAAAERWQQVIVSDMPDVVDDRYGPIDDLVVELRIEAIDGPGRLAGGAAYLDARSPADGGLPYSGFVQIDEDDIAAMEQSGTLVSLIAHELGHVLGFSHGWLPRMHLVDPDDPYRYVGANGLAAYRTVAGDPSLAWVPIEQEGGAGTRGGHLDEEVFGDEMMTGWIEQAPPWPISIVTVGVLQDLGYAVDYGAAEPLTL